MTNLPTFSGARDADLVEHLEATATQPALKKILYDKIAPLPYRPIPASLERFASDTIKSTHCFSPTEVHPIGVYSLGAAGYSGSGHVIVDDKIWASPEVLPAHVKRQIESSYFPDIPETNSPRVKRHESAIAVMTPGANIYGHLLLDILPRIRVARAALGDLEPTLKYLVHDDVPAFVYTILREALGIGEDRLIKIPRDKVIYEFARLFVPTLIHSHYNFHPTSADIFSSFLPKDAPTKEEDKFIFVSRSDVVRRRAQFRILENSQAVEELFRDKGYRIITPETLSWTEQVKLFTGCHILCGEYGSALHNSLFAGRHTRILSIDCFNDVQSKIASFCGQDMGYVAPAEKVFFEKNRYSFRMDMDMLAKAEDAIRSLPPAG